MPVMSIGTGGGERAAGEAIVAAWLGLGGRSIDTAWLYENNAGIRTAIAKSGLPRESLFLTGKVPGCVDATRYVEDTLAQLGVTYMDLFIIHYPDPPAQCSQTWAQLEGYLAAGKFRAIGVGNFRPVDLQNLFKTAKVKPAVNQMLNNVCCHDDESVEFCRLHHITVEAYSPLGREGMHGNVPANPAVASIAQTHGLSPYQVALKWIVQHGHMVVFQSASAEHQAVDADLFRFNLSAQEMSTLDVSEVPAEEQARYCTPVW